jgi:WhiB family redox-sensing transcriptional regulator
MADAKVCTKCGEMQPLTAYAPDSRTRDGRQSRCHACQAKAQAERQARLRAARRADEASDELRRVAPAAAMPALPGRAACRDADPELFFPTSRGADLRAEVREAKAVCARCPVRAACAAWALEHREHGVWGGLDEGDREAVSRRQHAA